MDIWTALIGAVLVIMPILWVASVLAKRMTSQRSMMRAHPALVGMVGRAGHGKDSIGNILVSKYGFNRDAFAKPLKDASRVLWLFSEEQLYGSRKEQIDSRWGISPREAMQFLGTEVGREAFQHLMPQIGQQFWLEHLRRRHEDLLKRHQENPENVSPHLVVCDVRFQNEAELIRQLGGVLIKVVRPNHNAFAAATTKVVNDEKIANEFSNPPSSVVEQRKATHQSEASIDQIETDVTILNDGSLEDLSAKVDMQVASFLANPPSNRPATPIPTRTRKPRRTPKAD